MSEVAFHVRHCRFVPVSLLLEEGSRDWFYSAISENAPFSWGDNDRTLIRAKRLKDYLKKTSEWQTRKHARQKKALIGKLDFLDKRDTLLDLES